MTVVGTYPFGSSLRAVVQAERSAKRVFVLGVYASAVHARWRDADGGTLVKALAVASEPRIFWDGVGAEEVLSEIPMPSGAGTLEPAEAKFNGPSGRSLDNDFLNPLGVDRSQAWLCDLVPHTCLNDGQAAALAREYEPRREKLGLPQVDLPSVPKTFGDAVRRAEIMSEVLKANSSVLVVLGDKPIQHFLAAHDKRWRKLTDFGKTAETYGRLHPVKLGGHELSVLPLAHPRQVGGLGTHSREWRDLHRRWKAEVASTLLPR